MHPLIIAGGVLHSDLVQEQALREQKGGEEKMHHSPYYK